MFDFVRFFKGLLIESATDRTKQLKIQISDSSTTNTATTITAQQTADRTLTLPDATDTLVARSTTETLQNKTLDNTNEITVSDDKLTIVDNGDATKEVQFDVSAVSAATTRTISIPNANTTMVGTDVSQTLSNKTLDNTSTVTIKDANLTIQDDADATKQARFEASSITSGQTRTFTFPDASATLVGADTAQSLTNKTIDADQNTISNIEDADIKAGAGIDASKLADGSVSNTEYQYLSNVTSDIQAQLDSKTGITGTFTDNRVLRADGATSVQDSAVTISDAGAMSGITSLSVDNISLDVATVQANAGSALTLSTDSALQLVIVDRELAVRGPTSADNGILSVFEAANAGNSKTSIVTGALTGNTTLVLPTNSTYVVGTDSTQTLSNKTLDNTNSVTVSDSNFTIQDNSDATKQARFEASGITAGQTRTYTLPDASTTLVGTGTTQVLTAKDIDGGTASDTSRITLPKAAKATLDGLTRKEGTIVYASDSDKVYYDDGSSLREMGSGGSGSKNYLGSVNGVNLNGDFELGSTSGWSAFSTTLTGVIPTGSISAGSLSLSATNLSDRLAGAYSLLVTPGSGVAFTAGQGFISDAFTIDNEDKAKVQTWKFYYNLINPNTATFNFSGTSSNTFAVYIYDVTNSAWIQPAGVYGMTQSSGTGYVTGTFQTTANSTQYRLAVVCVNSTTVPAGQASLYFDDFFLGPQTAPFGPVIADLGTETWTDSWANTTTSVRLTRIGNRIFIDGRATLTGTPTSTNYNVTIPAAYTAVAEAVNGTFGPALFIDTGSNNYPAFTQLTTVNQLNVYSSSAAGASVAGQNSTTTVPFTWASGDFIEFSINYQVAGWSSNVQMSSDTDTRVVAVSLTGSSTSLGASTPVVVPTTVTFDTHGAFSGSTFTAPVSGYYSIDGFISSGSTSFTAGNAFAIYYKKNGGTAVQMGLHRVGATATQVVGASGAALVQMNAGDTLQFAAYSDQTTTPTVFIGSIKRLSGPAVVAATETVAARYYASSTSISGSPATITYTTKDFDTHNAYSSGTFTVPVSGKYQVNASIYLTATFSAGNTPGIQIQKNGSDVSAHSVIVYGSTSGPFSVKVVDIINCNAGDTIRIQAQTAGTSPSVSANNQHNYLSIVRVGN